MRKTLQERLWERVDKRGPDECWLWTGCKTPHGYGRINTAKTKGLLYTHRIAYELANGPIPEGMHVCHTCDNPSCVNPTHLWIGTAAENMQDRNAKGRHYVTPHLSPETIKTIRQTYQTQQITQSELASMFGVSLNSIRKILLRESWKEVA